ncbi:MAG: hypothetical protein JW889_01635 [Verrucomicrobia bacterium]|nr:hypothetical protein [Verrucomicrobiota bacterium]
MEVKIGGVDVDLEGSGIQTFAELADAVQAAAAERNEVVVGTMFNGETLSPQGETGLRDHELDPDDVIEFAVRDANAVLVSALEETRNGLPRLEEKLEQVATALQCGSRQEAFALFSECLSHWRQVVHLLQASQACLGYDPAAVDIGGRSIQEMNNDLLTALQDTKRAMEQGDLVALSDLLEYELIAKVQDEKVLLDRLISMVV